MEKKMTSIGAILLSFPTLQGGSTLIVPAGLNNYEALISIVAEINTILIEKKVIAEKENAEKKEEAKNPVEEKPEEEKPEEEKPAEEKSVEEVTPAEALEESDSDSDPESNR